MFPNLSKITVHPNRLWEPGCWSIFNFLDLNPDWSPCDHQQQQRQDQGHQLRRISLVGNIKDPLKVLLQLMIKFPGLESIKVGYNVYVNSIIEQVYEFFNHQKPWLCLVTLTHLDLQLMVYKDDDAMTQFFRQLQTLEQLKSLVLDTQLIQWAKSRLSPGSNWNASGFFYFHSVTDLSIQVSCQRN